MRVSPEGRARIESFEGLRLRAYRSNIRGHLDVWTIGYGHTGPDVHEGLCWTQEQADDALSDRLANEFEPAVNRVCAGVPTTQGQFDAMACLSYNIGAPGFAQSEVAKWHRAGQYDKAADAFEHWDHYHGELNEALHNRRVAEAQVYLEASPDMSVAKGQPDEDAADASFIHDGVVYTPAGSDPIGHQKILPPAVATGLVGPGLWWLQFKHGIEVPAHVAVDFLGSSLALAVWLVPHGGRRK